MASDRDVITSTLPPDWAILIVFDEFHLMDTSRAFLTAAVGLGLFRGSTRSVWMTATATEPLCAVLREELDAVTVELREEEEAALHEGVGIRRAVLREVGPLTAQEIARFASNRTLVVVNRVRTAQRLYREFAAIASNPPLLLHSRFFQSDRQAKERTIKDWFGKRAVGSGVAITTQTVEAGLDLSCEHLLTEMCPVNALVQRAGRCARFPGHTGTVHVYDVPAGSELPYDAWDIESARKIVVDVMDLPPSLTRKWVAEAHEARDQSTLELRPPAAHKRRCLEYLSGQIKRNGNTSPAELIRESDSSVRVVVVDDPSNVRPATRETVSVPRNSVRHVPSGWRFDPEAESLWTPAGGTEMAGSYVVAVPRAYAQYTAELGLELGIAGERESPSREVRKGPDWKPLRKESWVAHSAAVWKRAESTWADEFFENGLLERGFRGLAVRIALRNACLLHDLGKLQLDWQRWAQSYQGAVETEYDGSELLAHTDFDWNDRRHREMERNVRPRRPPHGSASAYYAAGMLSTELRDVEIAAVLASILSHHGGWWDEQHVKPLDPRSGQALAAFGFREGAMPRLPQFERDYLEELCVKTERYWPLTAYLMRAVRLADQRATEETDIG
jgi:CRISPR-associated endonuclease/helicase Cas3